MMTPCGPTDPCGIDPRQSKAFVVAAWLWGSAFACRPRLTGIEDVTGIYPAMIAIGQGRRSMVIHSHEIPLQTTGSR